MKKTRFALVLLSVMLIASPPSRAEETANRADAALFKPIDVFQLEYASDPQISPDGKRIVYVRYFMDIMTDRRRSNLWTVDHDGSNHRPLTKGNENDSSPRWSPDGVRVLYVSNADESSQLYVRWMDTGQTAKLTNLTRKPGGIAWSPDGKWIAFSMMVKESSKPFVKVSGKPKKAKWADSPRVINKLRYRADGAGYLEDGYKQLFVLPAEGGTPRQITFGPFDHNGAPSWTPDSKALVFSANRHEEWEFDPLNSEVYEVELADGSITALTDRQGPDRNPVVSRDGKKIAYLGFDDEHQGYQVSGLYVINRDGSGGGGGGDPVLVTAELDRSVRQPRWSRDGRGLYFLYDDEGNTRIGFVTLSGKLEMLAGDIGGASHGRPYPSGSYSVADNGRFVFTRSSWDSPADVAVGRKGSRERRQLTALNQDLLAHKTLGEVEEFRFVSSADGREIQGWIVKPPDFDPTRQYPLILEIHGGPFANYGARFSPEIQLYASAGYVVLYTNPRGSTSYGGEFGNLIHHNYPGEDYDDLMSGVDALLERGYVDKERLFVTGGSGGGVLTAWIVGKTDRFRAAVVAKPVINWTSFALTSDGYNFFYKYWFPGFPWDHHEHYWKRSPLSLVGNVSTPTMLLSGESDLRTPISESEQFYQALKLRKIDAALVRFPGASHGIYVRPSNLIAKAVHILKWFETHGGEADQVKYGSQAAR